MPDVDYFPLGVRPEWKDVVTAVCGRLDALLVAEMVEKALAASLRADAEAGPHIAALYKATEGGAESLAHVEGRLPHAWRTGLGAGFVDAARIFAGQEGGGFPEYVKAALRRMAQKCCFGSIEVQAVGTSFEDEASYKEYEDDVLARVRFDRLAASIARNSDWSSVQAPRRRGQKKTTSELLEMPL